MKRQLLLFIFVLMASEGASQDIQKFKFATVKEYFKNNSIKVNGGLNLEGKYYLPLGIDPRQIRFQYYANGFTNISFGKLFKVPITFSYTNQGLSVLHQFYGKDIAQRFNRLSLKPTFKNHTLYLGTNALKFSNYSLAGHRFDGIGYEYKTKRNGLYGSAMWGRFLRKVDPIYEYDVLKNKPSLERRGEAVKLGYKKDKGKVELSVLSSKDLKNLSTILDLTPYRNIAIDLVFELSISKNIMGRVEYGKSLMYDVSKSVFSTKRPTLNSNAVNADIVYKGEKLDFGIEYSRIDPNFKTYGSYFFNNDLQTFSFSNALRLSENKIIITDKIGFQHNNLNNQSYQKNGNLVVDFSLLHNINENFNYHLNYSNFRNYSNFNSTYQFIKAYDGFASLDTINYHQINGNIGLGFQLNSKKEASIKKSLTTELMRQTNNSPQESSYVNFGSINGNFEIPSYNINYGVGFTYTKTYALGLNQFIYGPNLLLMKKIKKPKITISESFSWNINKEEKLENKSLIMNYLNIQCTFAKNNQAYFKYNTLFNKKYTTVKEGEKSYALESFFILGLKLQIQKSLKK